MISDRDVHSSDRLNLSTRQNDLSITVVTSKSRFVVPGFPIRALIVAGLLLFFSACGEPRQPTASSIVVKVTPGHISAPDTVPTGWSRLRVEEGGGGHIVVLFRMSHAVVPSEIPAFLAALDTARMTPAGATALGGPEVGEVGEIIQELTPGLYVLACLSRGTDGHRHATAGESRALVVSGRGHAAGPPDDAITLSMRDYVYFTDAPWPAGAQILHVVNDGHEDHQVRIDRLHPGVTLNEWLRADDRSAVADPFAGVARTSPGQAAYLPIELEPGTYVLYCLIPAAHSGALHAEIGMIRAVEVTSSLHGSGPTAHVSIAFASHAPRALPNKAGAADEHAIALELLRVQRILRSLV